MTLEKFCEIVSRGFSLSWLLRAILRELELPVRTVKLDAQQASSAPGQTFLYGGVPWIVAAREGCILVLVPLSAFEEAADTTPAEVSSLDEPSSKSPPALYRGPGLRL